jgi:hypothetical protein
MGTFEYLLLFAAVILGLAISDLAISLHRLLNAAGRVRWDWLSPMAAALAFVRIVTQWWTWHDAERIAGGLTFGMFLGILISATLLFLMAAVALPDEFRDDLDLRAYYASVSRRFWLLFAAQWAVLNGVSTWAQISISKAHFVMGSPLYLILPAALILAFVRNRAVQGVGIAGFLALYLVTFFGRTLS